MAVLSYSTIANIFKIIQPEGFESGVLEVSPLLGMAPKKTDFYGSSKQLDWLIDRGGGVSSKFTVSQAQAGVPVHKKPQITRSRLYCVRQINNEDLEATQNNAGALVQLLKHASETATEELKYRAGSLLHGDGSGAIGQIATGSNTGTATITLADPTTVCNFRVGGRYCAFTTVAGGLLASGAVVTLTGVNEDTGALTASGNWTAGITGVAAGDYLVPEGDFNDVPKGLDGWNPITLPAVGGGDNWFGVDRGGSVAMCGGRFAPSTGTITEVLKASLSRHARQGGNHDTLLLNPEDWANLEAESNNWQRINKNAVGSNGKEIASIGFNALVLNGPKGAVNVFSDPFRPRYHAKLLKMSSIEIWSLGEMFKLIRHGMGEGGATPLANADGIELRFGGYWNTAVKRPRDLMDITIPA